MSSGAPFHEQRCKATRSSRQDNASFRAHFCSKQPVEMGLASATGSIDKEDTRLQNERPSECELKSKVVKLPTVSGNSQSIWERWLLVVHDMLVCECMVTGNNSLQIRCEHACKLMIACGAECSEEVWSYGQYQQGRGVGQGKGTWLGSAVRAARIWS